MDALSFQHCMQSSFSAQLFLKNQKTLFILFIPQGRIEHFGRGQNLASFGSPAQHAEAPGRAVAGIKPVLGALLHALAESFATCRGRPPIGLPFHRSAQAADRVGGRWIAAQLVKVELPGPLELPGIGEAVWPF